ncbi:MAG: two-component system histidine kinase PnpS [Acidobacteriota bacterium]
MPIRTVKSRLFFKIMGSYVLLLVAVLGVLNVLVAQRMRENYVQQERDNLKQTAAFLANWLPADQTEYQSWADTHGNPLGIRITIIHKEGQVLADNQFDRVQMDNHATRPEIASAARSGLGTSIRFSRTLGKNELYLAYRVPDSPSPGLILRVAVPLQEISEGYRPLQRSILITSLLAFALALALGYRFTRSLTGRIQQIQEFSHSVARGNLNARIRDPKGDELGHLSRSLNRTADAMQSYISELKSEKNRIAALLEAMRAGILATDREERVTLMNAALGRILGLNPTDSLGRKVIEVVRDSELKGILARALREGREISATMEINLALPRVFEVVAVPLCESNSEPQGVVAVLHDITQLKKLENIRKDFVANVSHELRTPLTSIQGFAETLLDGALEDRKNNRRFLEIIRSHAVQLGNLTQDLLTLASLEAAAFTLRRSLVDLSALVQEVVESTSLLRTQKRIELSVTIADSVPPVQADGEKLRQVLMNLLDNAIKFTPEAGRIWIEVARRQGEDSVELHVRDTGPGIPSSDLPRVFERFYRVDKARSRDQGGTGLGLAIVRHIVEAHQGRVEAKSILGEGADFIVTLPIGNSGDSRSPEERAVSVKA